MSAQHCMLYVTASSHDEASRIAKALVAEKLAACANIIGPMQSVYRWQGKVEEAQEIVVIFKTRRRLAEAAIARVKALHSYDVPCALVYDVSAGLPAYLDWIDAETA